MPIVAMEWQRLEHCTRSGCSSALLLGFREGLSMLGDFFLRNIRLRSYLYVFKGKYIQ
jgi:hypothetical protein